MAEESRTEIIEENWDKKKIAVGIGCLIIILAGLIESKYILGQQGVGVSKDVKGIETPDTTSSSTTEKIFSLPSAQDVNNKVEEIQQQVTHLNVADIASSSPQIQQVIEQIQALPQLPAKEAKKTCMDICSKL